MNAMQFYFLGVRLFFIFVLVLCEEGATTVVSPCIFDQSENKTTCNNSSLNRIPAKGISELTAHLEIHNTSIAEIDSNAFEALPTLLVINLAQNSIWKIDNDAFANLTKLNDLKLSSNKLMSIAGSFSPNLRTLRKLNVSHNELTMLNNSDLSYLTDLQHLDLSWNHIQFIEKRSFFMLTALKTLYLNHNFMKTIAVKFQSHVLDPVSLHDNPWDCNCSLISAIHLHPVTFDLDSVVCSTPKEMNNKTLSEARQALLCGSESTAASVSVNSSSAKPEGSGAAIIPKTTPEAINTSSVANATGSPTSSSGAAAVTAKDSSSHAPGSSSPASTTKASGSTTVEAVPGKATVTTTAAKGATPKSPNVPLAIGPNGSISSVSTKTTKVAASLAPVIPTVPPTVIVKVAAGQPVNISCRMLNTSGGVQLSWHKDKVIVNTKTGSPLSNDKIEIKSATKQDGGTYCCAMLNAKGHKRKPHFCQHLRVNTAHSSTSPAVYVAVIILVVISVLGVGILLFRRYRRSSAERYGLLSDRNAFRADESTFRQESDDYL